MFEAVVASAWAGIALAFVAEVFLRTRVFAFGGAVTGFVALMLASYVIPGGGTLTTIMGILDDVMLRIHTVLIISSYAMIFVAAVIAAVYLFGYYVHTSPLWSLQSGIATSLVGGIVWAGAGLLFQDGGVTGPIKIAHAASIFWAGAAAALTMIGVLVWRRAHGGVIFAAALLCTALVTLAIGNHDFIRGTGATLAMAGLAWAIATGLAMLPIGAAAADDVAQRPALAGAGAAGVPGVSYAAALQISRPVMAGGAPGDEVQGAKLPHWLHTVDWSHLIILNLVFVLLFVGTILGAVWADYSWGRPWGWDPKEVFALNTWLVYAVLIHVRFVVRDRGLWTAWLSLAGCAMMAFNWCFVNFFIVGLHSYA
jgi:ABC-type transport system involved in cytochrome c biogenesis permease subunit